MEKDRVRIVPCGHVIHEECVTEWRDSNTKDPVTCPECRGPDIEDMKNKFSKRIYSLEATTATSTSDLDSLQKSLRYLSKIIETNEKRSRTSVDQFKASLLQGGFWVLMTLSITAVGSILM